MKGNGLFRSILRRAAMLRPLPGLFLLIAILFSPDTASAFKVKTHVWVGQQVLNDLADGKITIPVGDRI